MYTGLEYFSLSPNFYANLNFSGGSSNSTTTSSQWRLSQRVATEEPQQAGVATQVVDANTAVAAFEGEDGSEGYSERDRQRAQAARALAAMPQEYVNSASDVDGSDSETHPSIAGDSVTSCCTTKRRRARRQPTVNFQGERVRGQSAWWNSEREVGNCGIYFGNWGLRGSVGTDAQQKLRTAAHDRQIMKNPAQIIILCETTEKVEELLATPAVEAEKPGVTGLAGRNTYEHWVIRGQEKDSAVLIAARKDNCSDLQLLEYDPHDDHPYKLRGKDKMATSRTLTCRVGFKQNIGHLGTTIVVCGVHGNAMTMKYRWPKALITFWDRLAETIKRFGVKILGGDFNMSLTNVIPELRSRGILCDCLAWYPWVHKAAKPHNQPLGIDSCAIFYIGGNVSVTLKWGLQDLDRLTAVAAEGDESWAEHFDKYEGGNVPGQHWECYRSFAYVEPPETKCLRKRLIDLLTPSTSQEALDAIPRISKWFPCPYLRFKHKQMDADEWLVDGEMHNGSHFALCAFTKNSRARSMLGAKKRADRWAAKCGAPFPPTIGDHQQSWNRVGRKWGTDVALHPWETDVWKCWKMQQWSTDEDNWSAEVSQQQWKGAPY